MRIAVVGAGEMGKALGHILERAEYAVSFWDTDEDKRSGTLAEVLKDARFVFFCIPAAVTEQALTEIGPLIGWGSAVVTLSKGLAENGETLDAVFGRFVDAKRFAALMGPMLAEELIHDKEGAAVAASKNRGTARAVQKLFEHTKLSVESSLDVRGVLLCGVLKNIYAIGFGCCGELGLGQNFRGEFVSRAVREMAYIVNRLNGDPASVYGPAGLGDLLATGLSEHSKNHEFGKRLARGEWPDFVSEGSASLSPLLTLLGACVGELPLLGRIRDMVVGRKPAAEMLQNL